MKPIFDNDLRGVSEATLLYKVINSEHVNEMDFFTFEDVLSSLTPSRRAFAESVVELYKRMKERDKHSIPLRSSRDIYNITAGTLEDLPNEEVWALYLNHSMKLKKMIRISKGGLSYTVADTRLIFKEAVKIGASGIVLVHNHPSGDVRPSQADIKLTESVRKAGELMECKLLDHLIIGNGDYYSFIDEGRM